MASLSCSGAIASGCAALALETALLVADGTCPQIRQLLAAAEAPVLWLDGQEPPLQAVSRALAERRQLGQPVESLHWVSHGRPGCLQLGAAAVDRAALLANAHNLASWGITNLALWSCQAGADHRFIALWEELTGASVWSSSGVLGRLEDGSSDWTLASAATTAAPALPVAAAQRQTWRGQLMAHELTTSNVYGVYADGSNIYAATNGGLSISNDGGSTFTNRTTDDGLGDNQVYGVYVDDNKIYAATAGGLSISSDGGSTFTNRTMNHGLGSAFVLGVYADGSNIYAATAYGLSISSNGGIGFTNFTNGLGNAYVTGVFVDGGNIYAATNGGLSISYDSGSTFTNRTTNERLGDNQVYGVYVDDNKIYAATAGGLSISNDGGSTFTNRTTTDGLGSDYVYDVYAIGTNVYAATDGGLSISYDSGSTFTNRTTTHGLGDDLINDVYAIGDVVFAVTCNGLSVSTDGGITFANLATVQGFVESNGMCTVYVSGNTIYAGGSGLAISDAPMLVTSTPADDASGLAVGNDPGNLCVTPV
jgi:hypothetical protein